MIKRYTIKYLIYGEKDFKGNPKQWASNYNPHYGVRPCKHHVVYGGIDDADKAYRMLGILEKKFSDHVRHYYVYETIYDKGIRVSIEIIEEKHFTEWHTQQ